jgi:hypothetical protein
MLLSDSTGLGNKPKQDQRGGLVVRNEKEELRGTKRHDQNANRNDKVCFFTCRYNKKKPQGCFGQSLTIKELQELAQLHSDEILLDQNHSRLWALTPRGLAGFESATLTVCPFQRSCLFLCRFIVATQYIRTKPAGINQPNVSKFWHFRKYKCVQFGKMRFFFRPKSSYSSLSLFHSLLSQTGKKGHRPKMTHLASGTAHVFTPN